MHSISMQQEQSAPTQSLSFPHQAFAPISGCGDWVQEKHVERVIVKVIPSISTTDFSVQMLPYPDNASKIKATIVAFASKSHLECLLAQRPSAILSIQQGLHPLKFSLYRPCALSRGKSTRAPATRSSLPHPPAATGPSSSSDAVPAHAPVACVPATTAPWAAVAHETAGKVVSLCEVMEEQRECSEGKEQGWQVAKLKKRTCEASAPSSSSAACSLKLYAYHLPIVSDRATIAAHFGSNVHITGPYPSSGVAQGKAHCWLTCSDMLDYNRLLQLNNSIMVDHQIRVEPARSKLAAASLPATLQAAGAKETADAAADAPADAPADAADKVDCCSAGTSKWNKWFTSCGASDEDVGQYSCTICQESDVSCSNAVRLHCVCKRIFHKHCIVQWFQSHASCPNCRFSFEAPVLPSTERSFDKFFDTDVQVSPNWQGAAVQSWLDVPGMCEEVLVNLQNAKYDERPLPVQQHACPIIASGRSLLATAETGSGKTAAYLVPIISRLHHQRKDWASARARDGEAKRPAAVIIAPTHELVYQIAKAAESLARGTCVRVSVVSGNLDSKQQRQQLNRGCDLLVASRGKALQMMQDGTVSLENTETLCFDEADVLLQGEGPQQIACMTALCPPQLQLLMFSATFHPERRDQAFAQLLPEDVVELHVGRVGKITDNVEQNFFLADSDEDKLQFLEHVLRRKQQSSHSKGGTIIFVNTRKRADFLCKHLVSMSIAATCMHGELVADERRENLMLFAKGHCDVLVATAAFGRGLDLEFVKHVINFDFPHTMDEYAQQCGRTGRGGLMGEATTIVPSMKAKHTSGLFFSEMYHRAVSSV